MWLHLTAANDYTDQSTRYPWYTLQTPVEIVIGKFQDTKWSPELFRRRWMNYIKIVLKHFVYSCVLTKSHRVIPQRPAALLQLHMLWLIQYHWKCWIYKGYAVSCARKHARALSLLRILHAHERQAFSCTKRSYRRVQDGATCARGRKSNSVSTSWCSTLTSLKRYEMSWTSDVLIGGLAGADQGCGPHEVRTSHHCISFLEIQVISFTKGENH